MVSGVNSVLFPVKISISPPVSKTSFAKIRVEKLKNKYNQVIYKITFPICFLQIECSDRGRVCKIVLAGRKNC